MQIQNRLFALIFPNGAIPINNQFSVKCLFWFHLLRCYDVVRQKVPLNVASFPELYCIDSLLAFQVLCSANFNGCMAVCLSAKYQFHRKASALRAPPHTGCFKLSVMFEKSISQLLVDLFSKLVAQSNSQYKKYN